MAAATVKFASSAKAIFTIITALIVSGATLIGSSKLAVPTGVAEFKRDAAKLSIMSLTLCAI
jgi:hypothetical protein